MGVNGVLVGWRVLGCLSVHGRWGGCAPSLQGDGIIMQGRCAMPFQEPPLHDHAKFAMLCGMPVLMIYGAC
jgi:hypothetical protein